MDMLFHITMKQCMLTCCTPTGPPKPTKTGQQWTTSMLDPIMERRVAGCSRKQHETQHPTKSTRGSQVVDRQPQTPSKSVPMALCVSPVSSCRTISLSIYQST